MSDNKFPESAFRVGAIFKQANRNATTSGIFHLLDSMDIDFRVHDFISSSSSNVVFEKGIRYILQTFPGSGS